MPKPTKVKTYTYRNGKKMTLYKKKNEFVVRAQPENLTIIDHATVTEQVSSSATRMQIPASKLEAAMTKSRTIAPTHHAYYQEQTDQSFDITDRILITFKKAPKEEALNNFINKYALRQLTKYSDKDYLYQLTNDTGMNPVKLIVKITESESSIAFAEHDLNIKVKKYAINLPTDPQYLQQWHLHTHTSPSPDYDPRSSARCEEAWQLLDNFGSADVVIGLSDDGCKLDHADFDSNDKFAGWGYFQGTVLVRNIDIAANRALMYETGANHGTSCAGVIAGEADGILTVGAAPNCRLLPIKWQSTSDGGLSISDSKLLTALNFIENKVDVFSNSWGNSPAMSFSSSVLNKIRQLSQTGGRRGKGIVFLWAAGNENCPIEHSGNIPIPHRHGWQLIAGSYQWVSVITSTWFSHNLTDLSGVMHIAALASNAQRSHYSCYGDHISLCAPTNNSHAYYRLTVRGLGIVTTDGEGPFFTNSFGGTSSATPLVAGIAGLILSANPNLTAAEVISILKRTASKDLSFVAYDKTPPAFYDPNPIWDVSPVSPHDRGIFKNINSPDGTWSGWFGHGKVDALEAVRSALAMGFNPIPTIKIQSALINPSGWDRNNETVTLVNESSQTVSIEGYALTNKPNKKQFITGSINAHSTLTIPIISSKIRLVNTGGTIVLLDSNDSEVHKVTYTRASVKPGVENVF